MGAVAAIDRCAITIDGDDGKQHVFRIDEDTFCRVYRSKGYGVPLPLEEIAEKVKVGAPVSPKSDVPASQPIMSGARAGPAWKPR